MAVEIQLFSRSKAHEHSRYHRPLVLRTHLPFRSESIVLLSDDAIAKKERETPPKARNFLSFDSVVR